MAMGQAYTRASELEPTRLYALLQMGTLQLSLGLLSDAQATFNTSLVVAPRHPSALLGAAAAALASARRDASMGVLGTASDSRTLLKFIPDLSPNLHGFVCLHSVLWPVWPPRTIKCNE